MSEDQAAKLHLVSGDPGSEPRRIRELLGQPTRDHHLVQFYEDDGFLCDNVGRFLAAGLVAGEPIVVIASEAHRGSFTSLLRREGHDVDGAVDRGQLVLRDAAEVLSTILVGELPDRSRFRKVIGELVEGVRRGREGRSVRAYGEMVDLLWRAGNRQGAIALEGLWNELTSLGSLSLLCAYLMGGFYKSTDRSEFLEVCGAHSHVLPTETVATIERADDRLRAIGELEQRARSLEHELRHRRELEAELREALARESRAREEAERSVRFNEMLAAVLGHDLRSPLGAITMGAHYINRTGTGEKSTRAAARILSSAERMSRMIDQLLDFTRIRVGDGVRLNHTRLDLAELCSRVKDEIEAANPECFIRLDSKGHTHGHWDYDRMLQVFSNLVANAVNHGDSAEGVHLHLDGREPGRVVVVVKNAGTIDPEILPDLFEPFRGGTHHKKTRGLGLGLYITRQFVLAHGGSIDAASSSVEGTTMRVALPRGAKPA